MGLVRQLAALTPSSGQSKPWLDSIWRSNFENPKCKNPFELTGLSLEDPFGCFMISNTCIETAIRVQGRWLSIKKVGQKRRWLSINLRGGSCNSESHIYN